MWIEVANHCHGKDLANLRLALGRECLPATALPEMCSGIASRYASQILFAESAHEMLAEATQKGIDLMHHLRLASSLDLWRSDPEATAFTMRLTFNASRVGADLTFVLQNAPCVKDLHLVLADRFTSDEPALNHLFRNSSRSRQSGAGCPYWPYVPMFAALCHGAKQLTHLTLHDLTQLTGPDLVPISLLLNLQTLYLERCNVEAFPDQMWHLPHLREIAFWDTDLKSIRPAVKFAVALTSLEIDCAERFAQKLPDELRLLPNLHELSLRNITCENRHDEIDLSNLPSLRKLYLHNLQLTTMPVSILRMKETLEELRLYARGVSQLPLEILTMSKMKALRLSQELLDGLGPEFQPWRDSGVLRE